MSDFEEIGQLQTSPTSLRCDNQVIILAKDPQYQTRTMHIERKFHFIRDDIVGKGKADAFCLTENGVPAAKD